MRRTRVAAGLARTASMLAATLLINFPTDAMSDASTVALSFGLNRHGRTGLGTTSGDTLIATPIDTTNLAGKTITQLATSDVHSMVLVDDGSVYSFGLNELGRTGLGTAVGETLIATPVDTTNLVGKTITQVAARGDHSLLLAGDGTVFAFGLNAYGQTGLGTTTGNTLIATPIDTTNLAGKTIKQIATGNDHNILLADDGTVFSFGRNEYGQTGLGTASADTLIATPIDTTNLAGRTITQVAAGLDHSLLLADDGTVFSFGKNEYGRTGIGSADGNTLVATPINTTNLGDGKIAQVAAGNFHSLLLDDDGAVYSFGWNNSGRTGLGTAGGNTLVATPIDTFNLVGFSIKEISVFAHSLLLTDDGTVFSFGSNSHGQTGVGNTSGSTLVATPIDATNLTDLQVIGISAGAAYSMVLAVPEPSGATLFLLVGLPVLGWRIRMAAIYGTNRNHLD